ncbi:MAG: hypothetical protein IJC67_02420 [Clostridia bacterium]|nr:hypothetical protein [Clostridia bacterium]
MKKAVLSLMAVLLVCAFMCSCAPNTEVAISIQPEERILQDARQHYRNASLVVQATCLYSHIDSEGRECFDVAIDSVIAGDAELGDVIHCTEMQLIPEERSLLYLGEGEDVFHTEDTMGYVPLHEEPLRIVDNEVLWDNTRISLDALDRDIAEQKLIISAPAKSYYYEELADLVASSDQIFIGRVKSVSLWTPTTMRANANGTSVEKSIVTSLVTVEAFGSIKGKFTFSDTLTLVNASEEFTDLLDYGSLRPMDYASYEVPYLKEGGIYLFFLEEGPDAKQQYYFPVNRLQGYVELNGEALSASLSNAAIVGEDALTPLVQRIRALLVEDAEQSSPQLRVD